MPSLITSRCEDGCYEVSGVDVAYQRLSSVVISNHVVEYSRGGVRQIKHLSETIRVLAPASVAAPGSWYVVDPHFRLHLLSWLGARLRHAYNEVSMRGSHCDCRLMSHGLFYRSEFAILREAYGFFPAMVYLLAKRRPGSNFAQLSWGGG